MSSRHSWKARDNANRRFQLCADNSKNFKSFKFDKHIDEKRKNISKEMFFFLAL